MNQTEMAALLETWQRRLRLQDWDVTVEIKRARDMEEEGKAGTVAMILSQRRAWVEVLDPVDIGPGEMADNDLEVTLVHELLHLFTEPLELPATGPRNMAEEQMLNALSRALVAGYREGGDPKKAGGIDCLPDDEDPWPHQEQEVQCWICGRRSLWVNAKNWSLSRRGPRQGKFWCSRSECQSDFIAGTEKEQSH